MHTSLRPVLFSATRFVSVMTLAACGSASQGQSSTSEGGTSIPTGLDIRTDKGIVHGSTAGGVRSFLGIPYAASTEGANRWKAPQRVAAWTGTKDATAFGPVCPQPVVSTEPTQWVTGDGGTNAGGEAGSSEGSDGATGDAAGGGGGEGAGGEVPLVAYNAASSEDCLSVNVWTPDPAPTSPLPVMVFIHGGAWFSGSGANLFGNASDAPLYTGRALVPTGNVVVVTLNYRLGWLGFLAHSALSAENSSGSSGNYGLLDQQAALQWVQANIAAFGGDRNNVTLFGESAGGSSVCYHMVAPASQGLFHRGIVESGSCVEPLSTLSAAESKGGAFANLMGCTDTSSALSCLRGLLASAIATPSFPILPGGIGFQDTSTTFFAGPILDGQFLTAQPSSLLGSKQAAAVPLLLGTNTSEYTLFNLPGYLLDIPVERDSEYQAALARLFDGISTAVAAQYPSSKFSTPNDALTQVANDAAFVCEARRTARLLTGGGGSAFLYSFNGTLSGTLPGLAGLAFHSAELPYVFGASDELGSVPAGNAPLSPAIQRYWTRFATTGNPNGGSDPMWPAYATAADQHLTLDQTIAVGAGLEKASCDFWDTFGL